MTTERWEASAPSASRTALSALVCAGLGWALGFVTWALLSVAYGAIEFVWAPLERGALPATAALAICITGGFAMGLWNKRFNSAPESFAAVIARVKETGSYRIKRPLASFVSFLMPLACGGPVGPEAGLTGFIAAGCSRIGQVLSMVRGGATGRPKPFTRAQKYLAYGLGIAGGVAGVVSFNAVAGGAGVPRFDVPEFSVQALIWLIPLTLVGMVLSWVFRRFMSIAAKIAAKFEGREPLGAAVCGAAIATVSLALPYVLFPGTEQVGELLVGWQGMAPLELMLTAVSKLGLLALCLSLGWHGGPFFPLIFSAVCFGLALAGVAGVDPALAVIVVSSALLARHTRKLGLTLAILLLCVPVRAIAWAVVPLVAGALLPTVEELAAGRKSAA